MTNHTDDTPETTIYHPGNFFAGVLLGGLAGAMTMLLLAPQSGKRTRAQIQLKGLEMREQATDALTDAVVQTRIQTRQLMDGVRNKAHDLQQGGQDLLAEQKARVSATVAGAKAAVQAAQA